MRSVKRLREKPETSGCNILSPSYHHRPRSRHSPHHDKTCKLQAHGGRHRAHISQCFDGFSCGQRAAYI